MGEEGDFGGRFLKILNDGMLCLMTSVGNKVWLFDARLVCDILPLAGLSGRLESGIDVLHVGCGKGQGKKDETEKRRVQNKRSSQEGRQGKVRPCHRV